MDPMVSTLALVYGKIIPLLGIVLIGYLLARLRAIEGKELATTLLYGLSPLIVVVGLAKSNLSSSAFLLPLVVAALTTIFAVSTHYVSRRHLSSDQSGLISFGASVPNAGFLGIPLTLALIGEEALPYQLLIALGVAITNYTSAFYLLARGTYTPAAALRRLLTMPFLYASFLGFALAFSHIQLPPLIVEMYATSKHAYSAVSMVIIGIALHRALSRRKEANWKTVSVLLILRFLAWPLCIFSLLWIFDVRESSVLLFSVILCNSLLPVGLNLMNMALIFDLDQDDAAAAVVSSTALSLILIPLVVSLI